MPVHRSNAVVGVAGLVAAIVVSGCSIIDTPTIRGSGTLETQEVSLSGFDSIEVRRDIDVLVQPAGEFSVTVTTDDNVVGHLSVELDGSVLRLGIDDSVNLEDATTMAEVTLPSLRALQLHGSAFVDVRGFEGGAGLELDLTGGSDVVCDGLVVGRLKLDLSGGSGFHCEDLVSDAIEASLSGGSELTISGSGATLAIDATGSSEADLSRFAAAGADIRLGGDSEASIDVSGVLEAELHDSSELRYLGQPVIGATLVTGGSVLEPVE